MAWASPGRTFPGRRRRGAPRWKSGQQGCPCPQFATGTARPWRSVTPRDWPVKRVARRVGTAGSVRRSRRFPGLLRHRLALRVSQHRRYPRCRSGWGSPTETTGPTPELSTYGGQREPPELNRWSRGGGAEPGRSLLCSSPSLDTQNMDHSDAEASSIVHPATPHRSAPGSKAKPLLPAEVCPPGAGANRDQLDPGLPKGSGSRRPTELHPVLEFESASRFLLGGEISIRRLRSSGSPSG